MITGNADVPMAVKAMKAGALDFIEKPIGREELLASIERALDLSHDSDKLMEWRATAAAHLAGLTPRQREVMERVLAGQPSKNIAADLGISQRTVENHRAAHHEEDWVEVAPCIGPIGVSRLGRRGGAPTGTLGRCSGHEAAPRPAWEIGAASERASLIKSITDAGQSLGP